MSQNDHPISCDVCLDLLPLVRDNVASDDSKNLVLKHIETCENCRKVYLNHEEPQMKEIDDIKTIASIRNKLYFCGIFLLLCGAFIGVYLSDSMGIFYNIILMPMLGAMGFLLLGKRWYLIPCTVFLLSYLWMFIKYSIEYHAFSGEVARLPLFFTTIYTFLVFLGILIGALLRFAFRRDI